MREILTALLEQRLEESLANIEDVIIAWREKEASAFEAHAQLLKHAAKAEELLEKLLDGNDAISASLMREAFDSKLVRRAEFEELVGRAPEDVDSLQGVDDFVEGVEGSLKGVADFFPRGVEDSFPRGVEDLPRGVEDLPRGVEDSFPRGVEDSPRGVENSPHGVEASDTVEAPSKRTVLDNFLAEGPALVQLDANSEGVDVPSRYQTDSRLVLRLGHGLTPPITDMTIDEVGISVTLTFQGQPYQCQLPWTSIYAIVSAQDQRRMVWPDDVPRKPISMVPESSSITQPMPPPPTPAKKRVGGHLRLVK